MRSITFAIAFFVLVTTASAQDKKVANIKAGASVQSIITILAGDAEVEGKDLIPAGAKFSGGPLDYTDSTAAMNKVLGDAKTGLQAVDESGKIIIHRSGSSTLPANKESTERADPYKPTPGDGDSWLRWFWHKATPAEREVFRTRARRPDYDPCYYGDSGCRVSPMITARHSYRSSDGRWLDLYGRRVWSPYWWEEERREFELRGSTGGVKAKGDTDGVMIFARGCFIAHAEEIDGPQNQKAAVPSGNYTVFTLVRVSDWMAFDLPVRPRSEAENRAVGARHLTLHIEQEMFKQRVAYPFDVQKAAEQCKPEPMARAE